MEKKWPPLKECPQFKCDMLCPYLQKFDWEDEQDDDQNSSQELRDMIRELKKFVQQVQTTRGYDVDSLMPEFMLSPFFPLLKEKDLIIYADYVNIAVELAIKHIGSKTGKVYKHVETLKVVDTRHSVFLLTFTAKETAARFTEKKKKNKTLTEAKKKKAEKKNKEVDKKKKEVAGVGDEQTFLAMVYAPAPSRKGYEILECLVKHKLLLHGNTLNCHPTSVQTFRVCR